MWDLKYIIEEWKKDSEIDKMDLAETSRKTPTLHAKYLEILSNMRLNVKRAEEDQKNLLKDKWLYYNGKMDKDEIKAKGWKNDPFDGLKVLKGEMDHFYNTDEDIRKSEETLTYLKTICDTLQEIIANLNWRHQTVKNIIEWKRFESGG